MQYLYAIMLIGYARVSTGEQTTAAQVAALKTSGCELIFRDNASGGRWDRPELHKLLSQLRKGDVLVVWTLDHLSRRIPLQHQAAIAAHRKCACLHRRSASFTPRSSSARRLWS